MCLAREQVVRAGCGARSRSLQPFTQNGCSHPDERERGGAYDVGRGEVGKAGEEGEPDPEAQNGRDDAGPEAGQRRNQHRRREE